MLYRTLSRLLFLLKYGYRYKVQAHGYTTGRSWYFWLLTQAQKRFDAERGRHRRLRLIDGPNSRAIVEEDLRDEMPLYGPQDATALLAKDSGLYANRH